MGRSAMGLAGLQENVFAGHSKIYAYMSPNKCSGMRSPLQEENSVAHHEVKCQGKPLAGIYRKREEKRNVGNRIRSSVRSNEQKIKDTRRGPLAPFPNQKSEAAEPPQTSTLIQCLPGRKIDLTDGKGRGVIASKQFSQGDFVVEYHGDLIEITNAKKQEALCTRPLHTLIHVLFSISEQNLLLIDHSKCGNCHTKLYDIDGVPHLILMPPAALQLGKSSCRTMLSEPQAWKPCREQTSSMGFRLFQAPQSIRLQQWDQSPGCAFGEINTSRADWIS
ncbi:hypothetical protein U0070_023163, partial [Myodes glareolus]